MNKAATIGLVPGSFLLSTPSLDGSYFAGSVIFMVECGLKSGSWGLVINNPTHVPLDEVFCRKSKAPYLKPLDISLDRSLHTFFFGGPVQGTAPFQSLSICVVEVGESYFKGSTEISKGIFVSRIPPSMEFPVPMLTTPKNYTTRIFFGYSGWAAGQLEREILEGSWEISNPLPFDVFSRNRDDIPVTASKFRECYERFRA